MQFASIRERLGNYPGRKPFNDGLKQCRRRFLEMLPSAKPSCVVLEAEAPWDRWSDLDENRYPDVAARYPGDRRTRLGLMRVFEGDLSLDPLALDLFDGRKVVWGSYDGIGREREPSISSFVRGPDVDLGSFVNMRGAFENNYFHFLYDFMPKLQMTERHVPRGVPLVIGEELSSQAYFRSAAQAGIFEGHTFFIQARNMRIGGRRVWVPSPAEPRREDLLGIASRFGATEKPSAPGLRLYVARPQANNKRRLVNETELFSRLAACGFVFFDPQEHDLGRQIETFARAETVVSPHGAGLTNLIWRAGRPCRIVELVNPSMHTLDMAYISARLGYDHDMIENRGDVGQPLRSSAAADIDRIMAVVDAHILKSASEKSAGFDRRAIMPGPN
jgi:hypothetical protein